MPIHTRSGSTTASPAAGVPPAGPASGLPLYLLLAVIALVHLLTLRAGQPWHDDFTLYILHARNLAEGRAYGDTGFIYNPDDPMHSPGAYPPGFPLLLAPVYALFGSNLFALRLVVIGAAVGASAMVAAVARRMLPPRFVLPVVALFGLQPYLVRFKNLLLPDIPFILFVLATLYLLTRIEEEDGVADRRAWLRGIGAGLCLYFAVSLRTAGVALFGAIVLHQLYRRRLPRGPVLACLLVAGLLQGGEKLLMPSGSGYMAQLADVRRLTSEAVAAAPPDAVDGLQPAPVRTPSIVTRVLRNVRAAVPVTDVLWQARGELSAPPLSGLARLAIALLIGLTGLLATFGYALRLRKPTVTEAFLLSYAGLILVWGFMSARYMLPLLPFLFLYGGFGAAFIVRRGGRAGRMAVAAVMAMVVGSYIVNLPRTPTFPYLEGVTEPLSVEMFAFVRDCTAEDARFYSHRPRALVLYGGREATSAPSGILRDHSRTLQDIRKMGADHIMTTHDSLLDRAAAALPFTRVFANERFVIYRSADAGPGADLPPGCLPG